MPAAWGVGMTRHPATGAVERRTTLWLNFFVWGELLESALDIKLPGSRGCLQIIPELRM